MLTVASAYRVAAPADEADAEQVVRFFFGQLRHGLREQGVGGSQVGTCLGLNPWESAFTAWARTVGKIEPKESTLAMRLGVSEGAVRDVQSPHHFDLPHHKDWKGMKFGHLLNNFKGSVSLVFGDESGVCLPQQVQELQATFTQLTTMRVEGAKHPVPFTESVCAFVLQALKLEPIPVQIELPQVVPPKDSFVQVASTNTAFDNTLEPIKQTEVKNDYDWRSRLAKWLTRFKKSALN